MRIAVKHETRYVYARAPKAIVQILRMTPRSHEGQHVLSWRIDCDADCHLKKSEDAFGNITHTLTVDRPVKSLKLVVEGEVETFDTAGLVSNAAERFAPILFLRETPLTAPSPAIRDLAARGAGKDMLDRMHDLMTAIHGRMTFDTASTNVQTSAGEAWEQGRGVCQDYAHVFIAAARCAGVPARFICGHFFRADGVTDQAAGHAWAEAYIDELGWVGFDPANALCLYENPIRVACGLDYLNAAPVRGAQTAGFGESMSVNVAVAQARVNMQH